jgi:hypothetical protein
MTACRPSQVGGGPREEPDLLWALTMRKAEKSGEVAEVAKGIGTACNV